MEHSFDIEIAKIYGVHSAILLNNIYFWVEKNIANQRHFYEGHCWTYSTKKAFEELFPYMTSRQIGYAIDKLIEDGIIITGNFNEDRRDRTLWYSITDKGYELLKKCELQNTKMSNGENNFVKPLPYINNTYIKENYIKESQNRNEQPSPTPTFLQNTDDSITPKVRKGTANIVSNEDIEKYFETTYSIYPRKVSKQQAKKTYEHKFRGLESDEARKLAIRIYKALQRQIALWQAENKGNGRELEYIPHFSSWLNDNFEDSKNFKKGR